MDFNEMIEPFYWVDHGESASICLDINIYLQEIFDIRHSEGFEGTGYDWASLANVFIDETRPDIVGKIDFNPETEMFVAYSKDKEALKEFILTFKETCENREKISDMFSRAELE